ncbi:M1 family metallopeptidase [Asanoa sp. WMMD1127]|uniref:M1 family metallopeptidase n=1 Tax=Asanoa sp. WMMD1127 TaxID=3016107 RepID=UPI00241797A7|nr:M1 family metallopeptidase [Asanoa sp. WMMD1127]MDG4825214.1 M1 family metallopeptidase [Asanoa sp. WMMD1127]
MRPDPYLPGNGNAGYRTAHYDLDLDYRVGPGRLSGRATITATADRMLAEVSLDLGLFRVEQVLVDGVAARYRHRAGKLRIRPAQPLAAGALFTVTVRYAGAPRPIPSRWGDLGWERIDHGALVASQPTGAPSWFPCNDHPSDKASYRIAVTAHARHTVVANGALVSRSTAANRTTWVYEQPAPMPTYLATVQIGRYALVDLAAGPIPQRAAVPPRLRAAVAHDFARQPEMVTAFARLFGPYPFGEYAVVVVDEVLEVPVEAHGLSIFGANHVDGRRGSERLVAHELAHQWFGNSLTVADWRHIWLNEGFAKYAEWLWSERSGGEPAQAHAARSHALLATQPQDLRVADPGVRRMFDDRVYQRGALTLHALRLAIGDASFFALLRDWTQSHRHGTVTTEQFTTLAQRHTSRALDGLFAAWLYEPDLP